MNEQSVRYALIGGFAMAMRGVQRATVDLDFILMIEDLSKAQNILEGLGYELLFKNENVSHYKSKSIDWELIEDYLKLFHQESSISEMKKIYEQAL